jgi:tetratricopeptide (TPR) repeat protein
MYFKTGNYVAEAETFKEFIESLEKLGAEGEVLLADNLVRLGNSYIRQQKYDDAIAAFRRAEKLSGKNPAKPDIHLLYAFARYHYFTGNYAESESHFTKVFALAEQDKDALDALTRAWYRKGYAMLLYSQGKTAQADEVFKTSIEMLKTDKAEGESDVSTSLHELATLFTAQGKYAEAEPMFKQAIELRGRVMGANHPELAASLEGYAGLLKKAGRGAEAAPLESRAQAIRSKQSAR